jgi:hypothetical protein
MRASIIRRAKTSPRPREEAGGSWVKIPAMTDFRARGTIMGLAGLTAVFGMGTGVAPPVWSPGIRPPGRQAGAAAVKPAVRSRAQIRARVKRAWRGVFRHLPGVASLGCFQGNRHGAWGCGKRDPDSSGRRHGRGGRRVGVVKRSAVGTGPLRRSPAVHSQPIDLVVFQEPSELALMETSS